MSRFRVRQKNPQSLSHQGFADIKKTYAIDCLNEQFILRRLFHFGGSWWIRTTEALSSRFTVCPHWPLGKAPIFICASALTALDYYSRIRWKKQALFQKYFCKRRNGKRTAAVASALQSKKTMLHRNKQPEIQGDHRPEYSAHANSAPWYFYACPV